MKKQNYTNHRRYYPPHHFILLPLLFLSLIYGIYRSFVEPESTPWILFSVIVFFQLYTVIMLRQHYALGNQNRILRAEFSLRYFELYGERSEPVLEKLSFNQVAALRFAPDNEFKELLHHALQDNLNGDQIKRKITNWRADNHRV